ncbi:MAG: hypothetical protein KBD01_08140 [Acidobacteria bacterium]|nr:hypothetical protein [Acidobacteriota bacterium]
MGAELVRQVALAVIVIWGVLVAAHALWMARDAAGDPLPPEMPEHHDEHGGHAGHAPAAPHH